MSADIATVLWKELKEILSWGGSRGKWGLLLVVVVFGIFMPLQTGPDWVRSPIGLLYWAWVPLFLVSSVVADAFAGERERHTLETLLASRLSDRAILFGKVGAAMVYALGIAWVSLLLGLVAVNVVHGHGQLLLYPLPVAVGIVLLSVLSAALSAGAGVLISLRAATVRQAQQTLSTIMLALIFAPILLGQVLPSLPQEWKERLLPRLMAVSITQIVIGAALTLALLTAALLVAALRRFHRAQLILD